MRRTSILVVWLLLAPAAFCDEDAPSDNPRNRRWTKPVIETVCWAGAVGEISEEGGDPEAAKAAKTVHVAKADTHPEAVHVATHVQVVVRNPGPESAALWLGGPRREPVQPPLVLGPGARGEMSVEMSFRRPSPLVLFARVREEAEVAPVDTALPPTPTSYSIVALVEQRTLDEGNRRFGSFARRLRRSLEDFHRVLRDVTATTSEGLLRRVLVPDRFHLQDVIPYDRADGTPPPLFLEHPGVDLAIACDEGGPLAGFWLSAYSIGHNFLYEGDGTDMRPRRGLWSTWGEQALWHELLHFRGVPDSYVFHLPKEALPGRATEDVPLPAHYALGIMNHPYQAPRLSALAATVARSKHGVKRVGACEDPHRAHGHLWRWVPERLVVEVTKDGRPLAGARLRWWRSARMGGLGDPRRQGVREDAVPQGDVQLDRAGHADLQGDVMGRDGPPGERSLWLLLEVEAGGQRRWDVLRLLELNEAWAAGRRDTMRRVLRWEELRRRPL